MTTEETDPKLLTVIGEFSKLLSAMPPELKGRQRISTEIRDGFLMLCISSSFRIATPNGKLPPDK